MKLTKVSNRKYLCIFCGGGIKLKELAGAFGFIYTIFLFIVNFNALTAKTRIEIELLTTENKIKAKYYSIIGLSFALSFLICDIYFLIKNFSNIVAYRHGQFWRRQYVKFIKLLQECNQKGMFQFKFVN
jgi:hypothetical protein